MPTPEECRQWLRAPGVNPVTKRKIKAGGKVYMGLQAACGVARRGHTSTAFASAESAPASPVKARATQKQAAKPKPKPSAAHCAEWKQNPSVNPATGRRLKMDAKHGVYAQLLKLCGAPAKAKTATAAFATAASETKIRRQRQLLTSAQRRQRLVDAIKKRVAPVIRRGESGHTRAEFARIMRAYLRDLKPCVKPAATGGRLQLLNAAGEPVVSFSKRIGSESVYGMAFLNVGERKGLAKLLRFSCKLMSADRAAHAAEVGLLRRMSALVEAGISPNMPMVYKTLRCAAPCRRQDVCPKVTWGKDGYFLILNELASGDMNNWVMFNYHSIVYESVVMQMVLAVYAFHRQLKHVHRDTHLGNFLIHRIAPGGHWKYRVAGRTVLVPNAGHQLVLWDPGMAKKIGAVDAAVIADDYRRPLSLLHNKSHHYAGAEALPTQVAKRLVAPMYSALRSIGDNERATMLEVLRQIQAGGITCPNVYVDRQPPATVRVLNDRAFDLDL